MKVPRDGQSTFRRDLKPHHYDVSGRLIFRTLGHQLFNAALVAARCPFTSFARIHDISIHTVGVLRQRTQFPSFATAYVLELTLGIPMRSWFEPEVVKLRKVK